MPTLRRKEQWYGIERVSPDFIVDTEPFQYAGDGIVETRARQKKVAGAVWSVGGRTRDELIALPDIRKDGSIGIPDPNFSVGGHLIAARLTGLDLPLNIVPVSKATNDKMSKVETAIANAANVPRWLEIAIPEYYDGADPRVPKQFIYNLYELDPAGRKGTHLHRFDPVVQDWLTTGAYGYPQKDVSLAQKLQIGLKMGWKIEDVASAGKSKRDLRFLAGHLPPPHKRPLAFLDYWLICYNGLYRVDESLIDEYIRGIALGAGFSKKWIRDFAIKGNILSNNNWLRSNVFGSRESAVELKDSVVIETHEVLMVGGGANAPHVDHIIPESLSGPNCFSNAQITSAQYNTGKGNHTKQFVFRDEKWKEEMLKKLASDPLVKYHTY